MWTIFLAVAEQLRWEEKLHHIHLSYGSKPHMGELETAVLSEFPHFLNHCIEQIE